MSRQISIEEVKKHTTERSSWVIIHHDVYDVTEFLEEHPGGADSLLEYAGKDGTQAFEDVAHSEDAREMMKKYKIGTIPENERKGGPKKGKCGFFPLLNREFIVLPASGNDCCEPRNVPKKTWRRFDGPPRSGEGVASGGSGGSLADPTKPCGHCRAPEMRGPCGVCAGRVLEPQPEPRVKAIVVPPNQGRFCRRVPPVPCEESPSRLKWVVIALAGAIIIGIAIKKYGNK